MNSIKVSLLFSIALLTSNTFAANPLQRAAIAAVRAKTPRMIAARASAATTTSARLNAPARTDSPQMSRRGVFHEAAPNSISPRTIHRGLSAIFKQAESKGDGQLKFWVFVQAHAEIVGLEQRLSKVERRLKKETKHSTIANLKEEKAMLIAVIDQITKDFIDIEY